jgi:hypothetical protein
MGGWEPRWGRSGRVLYYRSHAGLTRLEIVTDSSVVLGERKVLFDDRRYVVSRQSVSYDVHPDEDRFVMLRRTEDRGDLILWLGPVAEMR